MKAWTGCLLALALLTALPRAASAAAAGTPAKVLILYDATGPYGPLGELHALHVANLVGRFGAFVARPVTRYAAGDLLGFSAAVYVGTNYGEPLPAAFLDDVLSEARPVLWLYSNLWQLEERAGGGFIERFGFEHTGFDPGPFDTVTYKGEPLRRYPGSAALPASPLLATRVVAGAAAQVLALATATDGHSVPWALRSRNLLYLAELPFAFVSEQDRVLAAFDLFYTLLAPKAPTRRRALLRLEDVSPTSDPETLRTIADYLYERRVPFGFGVIPVYRDPLGRGESGRRRELRLRDAPRVVDALRYLQEKGGTLVLHGYTHQYTALPNPYDGTSGADFEFFLAHVDGADDVIYGGPVPEDSVAWAAERFKKAKAELAAVGLYTKLWEFPHYAASALDYSVVGSHFAARWERALYFAGLLSGEAIDPTRRTGQFFPYPVIDAYGTLVLPENLGNYEPVPYNNHPARLPAELVATAKKTRVVRDGFASFFYHPVFGLEPLREIVEGIAGLGYTFVSPASLMSRVPWKDTGAN